MKWVSNRIQTHSHTSEPASANTPSSRRNNIQNINLSDSNWRMNTNVRMCRHELFECWQLFHPHIPPPSNIPASTRSHIRSQGSREHQSDLEFATSLHRRVQKNWAPRMPVSTGRTERGAALRRQAAALQDGGVGGLTPALRMGGFSGGRCRFVERRVIAAAAGICRGGEDVREQKYTGSDCVKVLKWGYRSQEGYNQTEGGWQVVFMVWWGGIR